MESCPEVIRLDDAYFMHGASSECLTRILWTQRMLESDAADCLTECNQVARGVFTSESQIVSGEYAIPVRFHDEEENAPRSVHPLEQDFPA